MYLAKLKETNMNRLLELGNKYGYMLISAYRQPPKYATTKEIEEQNKKNNENSDKLEDEIHYMGLSFVPVYGGYREENQDSFKEERSYFILNMNYKTKEPMPMDIFLEVALDWCNEYKQHTVLVCDPIIGKPRYYTKDGKIENEFSGRVTFNDLTQDFYTSLQRGDSSKGKADRRFTYTECFVPSYDSIMSKHCHSSRGEILLLDRELPNSRDGWLN